MLISAPQSYGEVQYAAECDGNMKVLFVYLLSYISVFACFSFMHNERDNVYPSASAATFGLILGV